MLFGFLILHSRSPLHEVFQTASKTTIRMTPSGAEKWILEYAYRHLPARY